MSEPWKSMDVVEGVERHLHVVGVASMTSRLGSAAV